MKKVFILMFFVILFCGPDYAFSSTSSDDGKNKQRLSMKDQGSFEKLKNSMQLMK